MFNKCISQICLYQSQTCIEALASLKKHHLRANIIKVFSISAGVGWGVNIQGDSHLKGSRMLIISLKGINQGFWSYSGC